MRRFFAPSRRRREPSLAHDEDPAYNTSIESNSIESGIVPRDWHGMHGLKQIALQL
jgi:hypothetical protein